MSAATLIALGLAAPLITQPAAGASADTVRVTPRSLADDTVLGVFSTVGGGVDNTVAALAVGGDDTVYAGGYFTNAGGNPNADGIAAWSNRDDTWHALGSGAAGYVSALALLGDDTVYAGGAFSAAGGVSGTRAVAAWSNRDDTWQALGSGMTGGVGSPSVLALAVQRDDTVYVAGTFSSASGVSDTSQIAAWSNANDAWHSLGPGRPGSVRALTLLGDDTLIAGGAFGDAGGLPGTNNLAAWSTRSGTWSAVGGGVTGGAGVQALAAQRDDTLYVGGQFTAAGGVAGTAKVAAWANADDTWRELGGGTNDDVMALAFDDTHGLLYAGGAFSAAGTVTASRIAVWDTGISAWIPLQAAGGNGVANQPVMALALDDSIVYLGGAFNHAGGASGPAYLARWTWDAPLAEAVPASGAAGAAATVRGSGLIGVTAVRLDGSPVSYTRDDSTTIRVGIPAGTPPGTYPIAVDAVGGTATTSYTVTGSPAPTPPPPVYPPGAPTGVTASAGDASASVSWRAPADSGSFAISNYQAVSSPGGRSCLVAAPALTCDVAGLTNGTAYTFTVSALTGAGWGPASTPSNAATPSASTTKSIVITGSRNPADTRFARVTGVTTGLAGEQVTPYLKFPGEAGYTPGKVTRPVAADGTFDWERRTVRKVFVYFTHGSVKSNTVTIPAR